MKSFTRYITKHFLSFAAFLLVLLLFNGIAFVMTFYKNITKNYGQASPRYMLQELASVSSQEGIPEEMADTLCENGLWAMLLDPKGSLLWSCCLPDGLPASYTIVDTALFSRGYLQDYPVFVQSCKEGLLVLAYPKDSYIKITGNYFPAGMVKAIPVFFGAMLAFDLLLLFLAYHISKQKIFKNTAPVMGAIHALSEGRSVSLPACGELSEIAESINKTALILNRQNQARANWISGVSHDIRTPLSMIMGYAQHMAENPDNNDSVREQSRIISSQSVKIKELVSDLNLVSQLEYEMQPLNKTAIRMSKLLRSYTADLLNAGIPHGFSVEIDISPESEQTSLDCDKRLIIRAVDNLVRNSIRHNPAGCHIRLRLAASCHGISLIVEDDGAGLSPEKLQELKEKPHYMESTDERLDLRHGLGLLLVSQIAKAHKGTMKIDAPEGKGCRVALVFQANPLDSFI